MWSKTKKALMDRMADSLKKRVRYNFEVYTTNKCRWWSEAPVFYIHVDDALWFATNPQYYWKQTEYLNKNVDTGLPYHEYWETRARTLPDADSYASEYGLMEVDHMMLYIHRYLNVYNVKECLDSGNYILKMLAVLDRRIGKRTIKQLVDDITDEPEWIRKFIVLRAESEGIYFRQSKQEDGNMVGKS
ncbi:hypothetical protein [uncultured Acetatifactor sp.]|jgi:hypothetical protein|uniref:SF0329 family protein n=1 Tax=uncultured Acetatifactor sp. TaxID=1671927 RepID=UPI00272BB304|nr:hypothetical protein [uncultured Acetatifactor sp.]